MRNKRACHAQDGFLSCFLDNVFLSARAGIFFRKKRDNGRLAEQCSRRRFFGHPVHAELQGLQGFAGSVYVFFFMPCRAKRLSTSSIRRRTIVIPAASRRSPIRSRQPASWGVIDSREISSRVRARTAETSARMIRAGDEGPGRWINPHGLSFLRSDAAPRRGGSA